MSVENHRIFLGYSLVYLLHFLYIIFLHFCTLFVSFLCLLNVYIYVSLYYVTHSIKKNIIFFSHFTWYQSHERFGIGFCRVFNYYNPSSGWISFLPLHLHRRKHRNSLPSSKRLVIVGKFFGDCLNSGRRPHHQDHRDLIYPLAATSASEGQ